MVVYGQITELCIRPPTASLDHAMWFHKILFSSKIIVWYQVLDQNPFQSHFEGNKLVMFIEQVVEVAKVELAKTEIVPVTTDDLVVPETVRL